VDIEGTAREKEKDKVSGAQHLFRDEAGRATGWADSMKGNRWTGRHHIGEQKNYGQWCMTTRDKDS
jgi:hypothetical protein